MSVPYSDVELEVFAVKDISDDPKEIRRDAQARCKVEGLQAFDFGQVDHMNTDWLVVIAPDDKIVLQVKAQIRAPYGRVVRGHWHLDKSQLARLAEGLKVRVD